MTADLKQIDTAGMEGRLSTLRADLSAAEQRERAAKAHATEATIRGDEDADSLRRELADAHVDVEVLRDAISDLEGLIPETREAEGRTAAERRALGLRKGAGSRATEYRGDDTKRVEEGVDTVVEAVQRLSDRYDDIMRCRVEALILEDRFEGLEANDIGDVPSPTELIGHLLDRLRAIKVSPRVQLPRRLIHFREQQVRPLRKLIEGTPTAELLAEIGETRPGETRTHDQRHDQHMNAERDRKSAERVAALARVDTFVRDLLLNGPVLASEVESKAAEAGFAMRPDRNHAELSVREAAFDRLQVLTLVEERNGPVWWGLPNRYDDKRFTAPMSRMSLPRW